MSDTSQYKASTLSDTELSALQERAISIRQSIVRMLSVAGSGHSAGPLGMADVFAALYFSVLRHKPKQPNWPGRDYLLLSNGHICPVWYASLAEAGYFPKQELLTLRKLESRLQGHPHLGSLPGIENTGGPLSQGISQAAGLAYGIKLDQRTNRVFCVMSDGEHQEGQTWEAYLFAAKYKLGNLTTLIDRNHIQIDGYTEQVMPLEPLAEKLTAFGWHVQVINGHTMAAIVDACAKAATILDQPSAIICETIPGKSIALMEGDYKWHGQAPNIAQAKAALQQLRTLKGQLWQE